MPVRVRPPDPLPANSPIAPPRRVREIAYAIKALNVGAADKSQQTLALAWIIRDLCGTYDFPYRPGSARDSDVAMGKMFVGQQIVAMVNMTMEQIDRLPRLGPATQEDDDAMRDM